MIEQLATGFERRFLFGLGRHLWNVVGVGGVIAIVTGGIFALSSSTQPVQSFEDWYENKMNVRLDLHTPDYESYYVENLYETGDYCFLKIDSHRISERNLDRNSSDYERSCEKYASILAGLGFIVSPSRKGDPAPFDSRINDKTPAMYLQLYQDKKDEYVDYSSNIYESNIAARGRGALSLVLLAWGASTVAAVSVISAVLAVERNTRKD